MNLFVGFMHIVQILLEQHETIFWFNNWIEEKNAVVQLWAFDQSRLEINLARSQRMFSKVWLFWKGHKIWINLPTFLWCYLVASKKMWKIVSNFVAFSKYLNFTYLLKSTHKLNHNENLMNGCSKSILAAVVKLA